jgi:hypothetical protein
MSNTWADCTDGLEKHDRGSTKDVTTILNRSTSNGRDRLLQNLQWAEGTQLYKILKAVVGYFVQDSISLTEDVMRSVCNFANVLYPPRND